MAQLMEILDGDGDLDLVVNNENMQPLFLKIFQQKNYIITI